MTTRRAIVGALAIALVLVVQALTRQAPIQQAPAQSPQPAQRPATTPVRADEVALAALPVQAQQMLALIKKGGPFPYQRDGIVFGNFERRLPIRNRGYYHEYTVPTPGARDRGARRIIAGAAAEYYYTDDHYETFRRIRE
jgi:ribonuclease T1